VVLYDVDSIINTLRDLLDWVVKDQVLLFDVLGWESMIAFGCLKGSMRVTSLTNSVECIVVDMTPFSEWSAFVVHSQAFFSGWYYVVYTGYV
jgi:hypothetical protein